MAIVGRTRVTGQMGFLYLYLQANIFGWFLHRISVIFRVRSAKAVKITDLDLMKRLGIIVGMFTALLVIRTLVAPPVSIVSLTSDDLKAWLCKSDWWDHSFTISESTINLSFLSLPRPNFSPRLNLNGKSERAIS